MEVESEHARRRALRAACVSAGDGSSCDTAHVRDRACVRAAVVLLPSTPGALARRGLLCHARARHARRLAATLQSAARPERARRRQRARVEQRRGSILPFAGSPRASKALSVRYNTSPEGAESVPLPQCRQLGT